MFARSAERHEATHEVRERRNQLRHVAPRPELLATQPNEVWSWDITDARQGLGPPAPRMEQPDLRRRN